MLADEYRDFLMESAYGPNWRDILAQPSGVAMVGGAAVIDATAGQDAQARAMLDMERASHVPALSARQRVAYYLIRVAMELVTEEPAVHVRLEALGGQQPLVSLTVTRQQYPHGHPGNDGALPLHFFDPEMQTSQDEFNRLFGRAIK